MLLVLSAADRRRGLGQLPPLSSAPPLPLRIALRLFRLLLQVRLLLLLWVLLLLLLLQVRLLLLL